MGLSCLDWMIAVASVVAVFAVGLLSSRIQQRRVETSPTEFFLAGRRMPWWISACSIFASNIGTEHFIGQAGLAATTGMAVCLYEWTAVYILIGLAWVFAPVYLRNRLRTIPEYLELRFDRKCRSWFVIVTLLSYALTKIGCSLFSGAVVLDVLLDLNLWTSAPIILILTAIYTTFGGLTAVMYTDTLQSMIFLIGGFIGGFLVLDRIGGYSELKEVLRDSELHWFLHNIHPLDDKDFPWLGMSLGLGIVALTYWCIDQEIAQRVLSSESLDHAKLGVMTAGVLKLTPFLITVMPGMVARGIYEKCLKSDGLEFGEWCSEGSEDMSDSSDSNKAYPLLVLREFPTGVKGLMVAAFLSAMMSSLSSVFNSASTIFTYDIYLRTFHPEGDISPKKVVLVGRITTVVLTVIAILWVPVIQHSSDGLYVVTQSAAAHVLPPVSAVFLVGLFWPRGNAKGAFSGFIIGSIVGLVRLGLSLIYQDYCDDHSEDVDGRGVMDYNFKSSFLCLNFLLFAIFLCLFCIFVIVIVSLSSEAPDFNEIHGCLFQWPDWITTFLCKNSRRLNNSNLTYNKTSLNDYQDESEDQDLVHDLQSGQLIEERKEWLSPVFRSKLAKVIAVILFVSVSVLIGFTH